MKRFSKILTLILAIVVIVTAFTVVALAEDKTAPKVYKQDFNAKTVGSASGQFGSISNDPTSADAATAHFKIREDYPNGNKYLVFQNYSTDTTSTLPSRPTIDYSPISSNASVGRVGNNPIMALDFDFMTPDGSFGQRDKASNSASIKFRPYYVKYNASNYIATGYTSDINFYSMGLSSEAYLWQHVTIVIEWLGELNYKYYIYVNGGTDPIEKEFTITAADIASADGTTQKYGNVTWGHTYFYARRYNADGKVYGAFYLDNITYSYFSSEYKGNIDEVGNYTYNENYVMPETYRGTIATVTVGDQVSYFDDIGKAVDFAAANPSSTFSLASDMTSSYIVDKEMTIDARKRDAEGNLTGEVYAGVVEKAITNTGYYVVETETPGIYQTVKGDFMYITSAGVGTGHPADQFASKFSAGTGATLKLLNDITVDAVFTVNRANFTLDLNGYALKRLSYYGSVYNYDEAAGDYVKADTGIKSKGTTLFTLNSGSGEPSYGFLITSSNGRGAIYNLNYSADSYYNGDVLVKRDNLVCQRTTLLYTQASYNSPNSFTFKNFDHFGGIILTVDYNGRENLNFYFDNIKHYQMNSYASNNAQSAFYLSANHGFNLQVTNSLFYFNDHAVNMTSGLIRLVEPLESGYTTDIKFTNCDIIANDDGADRVGVMTNQSGENIQLVGCRVYNFDTTVDAVRISQGTLVNYKKNTYHVPTALNGWTNKTLAQNITKTYEVPSIYEFGVTDGDIQSINLDPVYKNYECTYNRICTKEVDVTLGDKTVTLTPGVSTLYDNKALRVYADTSDELLNEIFLLQDANGTVYESILGINEDGQFVFDWDNLTLTASEKTMLLGGIKYASFNLSFLSGFRYNIYIPVDARLSDVTIEGYTKGDATVWIDGYEYEVFYATVGTAAAADSTAVTATFKVDGTTYTQTWDISALVYADLALGVEASDRYAHETEAIGKMLKFIKEAALCVNSEADVAAIEALIAKTGVALTYGDYTAVGADLVAELGKLDGAVTGLQYVIYNGVAAYRFTLAGEDTEISFKVNGETVGFTREGNVVTLDAQRVYDIIDDITITSGDKSTKINLVDYLTFYNADASINIAKALYEFGLAADAYKADIMADANK